MSWINIIGNKKGEEIWKSIKKEFKINHKDFRLNLGNKEIYPNE